MDNPHSSQGTPDDARTPLRADLEFEKLKLERDKLVLENAQLASRLGWFSTAFWPIAATILTVGVGLVTAWILYSSQQSQGELKRREILFQALHDATAKGDASIDLRISGAWALSQFWEPEYEVIVANALAAILVGDGPQQVRLNAAEVIGTAISGIPASADRFSRSQRERAERLAGLLYGRADQGAGGVISRVQATVRREKNQKEVDPNQIAQKLEATREAIRYNWKWLRKVYLRGHDLSRILLYQSDLRDSDLAHAKLSGANLCKSNLYLASLEYIQDWGCIDVRYANIKGVQHAPEGFRKFALDHGAVEMDPNQWVTWVKSHGAQVNCLVPTEIRQKCLEQISIPFVHHP
jgi:hypothetical protein